MYIADFKILTIFKKKLYIFTPLKCNQLKKQDYIKYIVYQLLYYYIVGRFRY